MGVGSCPFLGSLEFARITIQNSDALVLFLKWQKTRKRTLTFVLCPGNRHIRCWQVPKNRSRCQWPSVSSGVCVPSAAICNNTIIRVGIHLHPSLSLSVPSLLHFQDQPICSYCFIIFTNEKSWFYSINFPFHFIFQGLIAFTIINGI